jgi:hypothetical protein
MLEITNKVLKIENIVKNKEKTVLVFTLTKLRLKFVVIENYHHKMYVTPYI